MKFIDKANIKYSYHGERGIMYYICYSLSDRKKLTDYLQYAKPIENLNISTLNRLSSLGGDRPFYKYAFRHITPFKAEWERQKLREYRLLQSYKDLLTNGQPEVNRFMKANQQLYGSYDSELFRYHLNRLLKTAEKNSRDPGLFNELLGMVGPMAEAKISFSVSKEDFARAKKFHDDIFSDILRELKSRIEVSLGPRHHSAYEVVELINSVLNKFGLDGWLAVVSKDTHVFSVNRKSKRIRVANKDFYLSSQRLIGLLMHEIIGHVMRAETNNDSTSPLNLQIEEGVGVFLEQLSLKKFHHTRHYRYLAIGLAIGADGRKRNIREVYEIMWRLRYLTRPSTTLSKARIFSSKEAIRVFRGIPLGVRGAVLLRDKCYLEGNVMIWKRMGGVKGRGQFISLLYGDKSNKLGFDI